MAIQDFSVASARTAESKRGEPRNTQRGEAASKEFRAKGAKAGRCPPRMNADANGFSRKRTLRNAKNLTADFADYADTKKKFEDLPSLGSSRLRQRLRRAGPPSLRSLYPG